MIPISQIQKTIARLPRIWTLNPQNRIRDFKLEEWAQSNIYRNTPRSGDAHAAIRFLAHSASFYCSTLNLRDETERKKPQYIIEDGLNSGRKGEEN